MFKKKKLGLIERLEKRKLEKENRPLEDKKEEEKPKKIIKKTMKKVQSHKDLQQSTKSQVIKEPPQELLHRLAFGEKANVKFI